MLSKPVIFKDHAECLLLPALPPTEGGSIHYKLILDPASVNVDHLSMESVVVMKNSI